MPDPADETQTAAASFMGSLVLGAGGSARWNGIFLELLQAELELRGFVLLPRFRELAATIFLEAARESAGRDAGAVVQQFPISTRKAS